jgi:hypothetical protein
MIHEIGTIHGDSGVKFIADFKNDGLVFLRIKRAGEEMGLVITIEELRELMDAVELENAVNAPVCYFMY